MKDIIEEIKQEKHWTRKCLGILTIHTTQQASRENTRGVKWKIADTAALLGLSIGYVSESIMLAKGLAKYNGKLDRMTRERALKFIREWENFG